MVKEYEELSKGMSVLRNVVDLESAELRDVVIRNITEDFWQACIKTVDIPNMRYRVCAIGTPGIGKTAFTPILIRMLLLKGHTTVVYIVRTNDKDGWYYEFKPSSTTITVNVYPETLRNSQVDSLLDPMTYYVVDPGKTKDNCDPNTDLKAKVIVVTSPDERHWGESEFAKQRGSVLGIFKFFPLWSLEALLNARPSILGRSRKNAQIEQRFRQVGGVPRPCLCE